MAAHHRLSPGGSPAFLTLRAGLDTAAAQCDASCFDFRSRLLV